MAKRSVAENARRLTNKAIREKAAAEKASAAEAARVEQQAEASNEVYWLEKEVPAILRKIEQLAAKGESVYDTKVNASASIMAKVVDALKAEGYQAETGNRMGVESYADYQGQAFRDCMVGFLTIRW